MAESFNTPSDKIGLPPGSIIHVGDAKQDETLISVVDYNKKAVRNISIKSLAELSEYINNQTVTWITVFGLSDYDLIGRIGMLTDIHPLVVEDILTVHQRPKLEEYENYLFIVLSSLNYENETNELESEQISLLVFKNSVFVFREKTDNLFNPVLQRIKQGRGRIREMGSDYLAYAIIDIIVDKFFIMTEAIEDSIDLIEENLLSTEHFQDTPIKIQRLKKDLIFIKKNILPIKELTSGMLRSESELINERTKLYLRDVYDHAIRVSESVESHRDILSGLLSIYISGLSNKMNEVMKVLTIFASVFIPLTFIAGIYGMNFEYMPELKLKWAYPALWLLFIIISSSMLLYFKKKRWL